MQKNKGPAWFKLWLHHRSMLEAVSDAVVGKAVKAALNYFDTGEIPELDQLELVVFSAIRADADDAYDTYRRDVENGRKGGRPPKQKSEEKPTVREGDPLLPSPTQGEGEGEGEKEDNTVFSDAVSLLNQLSGSSFRPSTKATRRVIRARLREGYSGSDLETVIRHQCRLWGKDEKMRKYLRPETLFGSKFEGYLSDARRQDRQEEPGYILADPDDPWDAAVTEGQYV